MCATEHFGFVADLERYLWLTDYLDDLEADFSVFHRVDDMRTMESARFLRFAVRMGAYSGVMASRLANLEQENGGEGRMTGEKPREIDSSRTTLSQDPATAALISWGG